MIDLRFRLAVATETALVDASETNQQFTVQAPRAPFSIAFAALTGHFAVRQIIDHHHRSRRHYPTRA